MRQRDNGLIEAWRQAGSDLGVRVIAPYRVSLPGVGEMEFEVYLPDFGSAKGTLLMPIEDSGRGTKASRLGFFVSQASEEYGVHERQRFTDALNDLQWCASTKPPSWYTGQPWT